MLRSRRVLYVSMLLPIVAGCASMRPPPLSEILLKCPTSSGHTGAVPQDCNPENVINHARSLAAQYASRARAVYSERDAGVLSAVGLALAAAAAAVYKAHNDTVTAFGLAGGTAGSLTGYFNPAGQYSAYRNGAKALQCVVDEASKVRPHALRFLGNRTAIMSSFSVKAVPASQLFGLETIFNEAYEQAQPSEFAATINDAVNKIDGHVLDKVSASRGTAPSFSTLRDQLVEDAIKTREKQKATAAAMMAANAGAAAEPINALLGLRTELDKCVEIAK